MSARGAGRGRGSRRGGAQGVPHNVGGAVAPLSVAAQLRQTARATEPEELKTLLLFKEMGAVQVRSTYGLSGRLSLEVGFDLDCLPVGGLQARDTAPVQFFDLLQVENAQRVWERAVLRDRALSRRAERLGPERANDLWETLSPEDRRILLLSNKDFQSFRGRAAAPPGVQVADTAASS
jgi:hypothetical protein